MTLFQAFKSPHSTLVKTLVELSCELSVEDRLLKISQGHLPHKWPIIMVSIKCTGIKQLLVMLITAVF